MPWDKLNPALPEVCWFFNRASMLHLRECSRSITCSLQPSLVTQIVVQELVTNLQHATWKHRTRAIRTIWTLAHKMESKQRQQTLFPGKDYCKHLFAFDSHTLSQAVPSIVTACPSERQLLDDPDAYHFPWLAVNAIRKIAKRGDILAVAFVTRWLNHTSFDSFNTDSEDSDSELEPIIYVRLDAVKALGAVAPIADDEAINALVAIVRAQDDCHQMREAAVEALGVLGIFHNEDVVAKSSKSWRERRQSEVVDVICDCFEKSTEVGCVRDKAMQVLQHVASGTDAARYGAVHALLRTDFAENKWCLFRCLEALGSLSHVGDPFVIRRLLDILSQTLDSDIRSMSARILMKIAEKGDAAVVSALSDFFLLEARRHDELERCLSQYGWECKLRNQLELACKVFHLWGTFTTADSNHFHEFESLVQRAGGWIGQDCSGSEWSQRFADVNRTVASVLQKMFASVSSNGTSS